MGAAGTQTAGAAAGIIADLSRADTVPPMKAPAPIPSSVGVSARMSSQRRRDTEPELALRRHLFALGERFRVGYPVPGMRRCTIDIAFPRRRVAVLVDGCFWHRCPEHRTEPNANRDWWERKLDGNVARDRRVDAALDAAGWTVVRIWEHETVEAATEVVLRTLRTNRPATKVTPR